MQALYHVSVVKQQGEFLVDKGNKSFLDEADTANEAAMAHTELVADRKRILHDDLWSDSGSIRDALSEGIANYTEDKEHLKQLLFAVKTLREQAKGGQVDYSNISMLSVNLVTMLLDALDKQIDDEIYTILEREGLV